MDSITMIGIAASVLTGMAQIPQLIKLAKEKNADDLSVGMYLLLIAGLGTWLWYSLLKEDWVLFASNAFSILINIFLVILIIKYKNK